MKYDRETGGECVKVRGKGDAMLTEVCSICLRSFDAGLGELVSNSSQVWFCDRACCVHVALEGIFLFAFFWKKWFMWGLFTCDSVNGSVIQEVLRG